MHQPKEGELFARNYLRSTTKLADSLKARKRIAARFLESMSYEQLNRFPSTVKGELGVDYPQGTGWRHNAFWETAEIGDFLSAITLWLRQRYDQLTSVRRIFEQENLHYRIDDKGGVHFLVDVEFSSAVETTLAGLERPQFTAARAALQEGLKALSPAKPSGKALIRGVFEAAESSFLVVCGPDAGNRLNKQAMDKHLRPLLLARYHGVHEAEDKVNRMLAVFEAWMKDAHPYRHGTAAEQEHEAPLELAVLSATGGMGFIRFLAGLA